MNVEEVLVWAVEQFKKYYRHAVPEGWVLVARESDGRLGFAPLDLVLGRRAAEEIQLPAFTNSYFLAVEPADS